MDIRGALLQCLTEHDLGLSKQEIERILNAELLKSEEDMDCEIVDMCIELLARIDNVPLPDEDAEVPPAPTQPVSIRSGKRKSWKVALLVAAIFVFTVSATLFVSAQVFNFNIIHYVVEFFSDHTTVDYGANNQQAESYLPANTDIRRELGNNGISPVLLPDAYLQDAQVTIDYQYTDISKAAGIKVKNGSITIDISIIKYTSKDFIGEGDHQGEIKGTRELTVNDLAILVMDFGNRRSITFTDDSTQYIIETSMDMESTINLAESIQ